MQEEEAIDHVSPVSQEADYNAKNYFVHSIVENILQAWYCGMAHLCFQATLWVWIFVGFGSLFLFINVDTQENHEALNLFFAFNLNYSSRGNSTFR